MKISVRKFRGGLERTVPVNSDNNGCALSLLAMQINWLTGHLRAVPLPTIDELAAKDDEIQGLKDLLAEVEPTPRQPLVAHICPFCGAGHEHQKSPFTDSHWFCRGCQTWYTLKKDSKR